jgi:hypothetical protein
MKSYLFGCSLALSLSIGGVRADRLIWTPTADISRPSLEYMGDPYGSRGVATGQIGLGRQFELQIQHYQEFKERDSTEVGGQFTVLPEGFATPGIALGVWDVANESPRGRRVFGVLSKSLPLVHKLPIGPHDIRIHLGVGSGTLSGIFVGAQAGFPFGFGVYAEYDTRHINAGLSWSPFGIIHLKAESWGGHLFVGAQLRTSVKF